MAKDKSQKAKERMDRKRIENSQSWFIHTDAKCTIGTRFSRVPQKCFPAFTLSITRHVSTHT